MPRYGSTAPTEPSGSRTTKVSPASAPAVSVAGRCSHTSRRLPRSAATLSAGAPDEPGVVGIRHGHSPGARQIRLGHEGPGKPALVGHVGKEPVVAGRQGRERRFEARGIGGDGMQVREGAGVVGSNHEQVHQLAVIGNQRSGRALPPAPAPPYRIGDGEPEPRRSPGGHDLRRRGPLSVEAAPVVAVHRVPPLLAAGKQQHQQHPADQHRDAAPDPHPPVGQLARWKHALPRRGADDGHGPRQQDQPSPPRTQPNRWSIERTRVATAETGTIAVPAPARPPP